jgi:hypothetical protein
MFHASFLLEQFSFIGIATRKAPVCQAIMAIVDGHLKTHPGAKC